MLSTWSHGIGGPVCKFGEILGSVLPHHPGFVFTFEWTSGPDDEPYIFTGAYARRCLPATAMIRHFTRCSNLNRATQFSASWLASIDPPPFPSETSLPAAGLSPICLFLLHRGCLRPGNRVVVIRDRAARVSVASELTGSC
jgi:hypothetical protein